MFVMFGLKFDIYLSFAKKIEYLPTGLSQTINVKFYYIKFNQCKIQSI